MTQSTRYPLDERSAQISFDSGDKNLFVELAFENADSMSVQLIRKTEHGEHEANNNPFYKALAKIKRDLRREGFIIKENRNFYKKIEKI